MEALIARNTPISPISVLPIAVNLVLAENGVTIAQPGNRSLALRSMDQTYPSSPINLLYRVF